MKILDVLQTYNYNGREHQVDGEILYTTKHMCILEYILKSK